MTNITKDELKHLQTLSAINIDESWEEKFLSKLDSVIWMLDKLNAVDISEVNEINWLGNKLRAIPWVRDFQNKKELLENVKHEVINNSILVKSALSND